MNYVKNLKVTIIVITVILAMKVLKNPFSFVKKEEDTVHIRNKVSSTKRIQPKFAIPPADRRNQLLDRFQSILDGSSPRHWFPIPGTNDCPADDKSYQVVDRTGQKFTIQPIFYEAMPYKNRSTAVFAWIGLPSEENIATNKVPAMVLVHGSGGTAYREWVELWVKRGFAAISIAVEGQTDEPLKRMEPKENKFYASHSHPGPRRYGVYRDWTESLENQWMFHAVADTILARLLLAKSFGDRVDSTKIGLMGISWGGIVSCTIAGVTGSSNTFSHIIPAYGCGYLADAQSQMGHALKDKTIYRILWDPCIYLSRATMPSLWLSSPEDPKFPLEGFLSSSTLMRGSVTTSVIPTLGHGHDPIWNRPESYVFSEYIWSQNEPNSTKSCWTQQLSSQVSYSELHSMLIFRVHFRTIYPFQFAKLIWSPESDDTWAETRKWRISNAELVNQTSDTATAIALIPNEAQAWMINMYTEDRGDGNLIVTSTYQHPP